MAGWMKMPLGMEVGLGPGHIVLGAYPAPLLKKGAEPPQFSAYFCCDQTAACIRILLGREVGLRPSNVLDGDPAPPSPKGGRAPQFSAHVY